MFKTIVVPTDGSEHAQKATEIAADLASKYDAQILILHVLLRHTPPQDLKTLCTHLNAPAALIAKIEEPEYAKFDTAFTAYGGPAPITVSEEALVEISELILNNAKATAEAKGVTDISVAAADGNVANCILATAEQDNADLIIMGSRGIGKFEDLLMGSVSHKVSHLSKCTCVTVK